jgi:hypothetical protein
MAPMWEAMGRPLLPQLAKGFAEQLKARIEEAAAAASAPEPERAGSPWSAFMAWLANIWRAVSGRAPKEAGRNS